MANPSNVTVDIDGTEFNAYAAHVGIDTHHDHTGLPQMGQQFFSITASVDAHDTDNLPFSIVRTLFELANLPTRDKIKPVKFSFWTDDSKTNAIAVFSFEGWISSLSISGGGGGNHEVNLRIVPSLGQRTLPTFR